MTKCPRIVVALLNLENTLCYMSYKPDDTSFGAYLNRTLRATILNSTTKFLLNLFLLLQI